MNLSRCSLLVLCEEAFSIVVEDAKWGRHHPLSISGHVGHFDVVPTPRRCRKRSKNGATREERTRERGKVTRLRQVHDEGGGGSS